MTVVSPQCPCGSGAGYHICCGPLHHGERHARTAEELMRSRYSAYARGEADYLFRTWHPRTRPVDISIDSGVTWTSLDLLGSDGGGEKDDRGIVEFAAHYRSAGRSEVLRERSRFERRARRWVYVDGDY